MITITSETDYVVFRCNDKVFKRITINKWASIVAYKQNRKLHKPSLVDELTALYEAKGETFNIDNFKLTEIVEQPIEPLLSATSFEEVMQFIPSIHKFEYEVILCVASAPKQIKNPPWLCIVAPPSNSKSYYLKSLNHPTISIFVDDMTENALAAGTAQEDQEVSSLLSDANMKNLVMNDMSSIFGQRSEKVRKWLSALTTAYGGDFYKYSPGSGNQQYTCNTTILMAMTQQSFIKHTKYLNEIGNRFLFLHMKRPQFNRFSVDDEIDYDDFRIKACSLIALQQQKNLPMISKDVDDYLFDFVHKTIVLRSFVWSWGDYNGLEGDSRLYQQLQMLCKCRARLHDREVLKTDVDFFKHIIYQTIPFKNHIESIYNGCLKIDGYLKRAIEAGLKLKIIEKFDAGFHNSGFEHTSIKKYMFVEEYSNYIEEMMQSASMIGDEE